MQTLRMLVVEDEEWTRAIIRTRLEKLGHTVVAEASDGAQAVAAAKTYRPDAIIMDIKMPIMNGIEAATLIMRDDPCAILFLSAFNDETLIEKAAETAAVSYMMKPFRAADIAPALEVAILRFRQEQKQVSEIVRLKDTLESRKLVDRAKGILMDRHSMTEEEAYRRIHYQARNQNKKMREIAQSILTAAELI